VTQVALDLVGCTAPPYEVEVTAAEGLRTLLGEPAVPLVRAVATEWLAPLAWGAAWTKAWQAHGARVVHAWHDLTVHRPLTDSCELRGEVVGQRPVRAGALVEVRYTATEGGVPVWSTRAGVLWRGLTTVASGACETPALRGAEGVARRLAVDADLALRYSRASGIWNPIHTDATAAVAAGLDGPILHGSATLALGLGAVGGGWQRVQARFVAPVRPPQTVLVSARAQGSITDAEVRCASGETAVLLRVDHDEVKVRECA